CAGLDPDALHAFDRRNDRLCRCRTMHLPADEICGQRVERKRIHPEAAVRGERSPFAVHRSPFAGGFGSQSDVILSASWTPELLDFLTPVLCSALLCSAVDQSRFPARILPRRATF